MRFTRQKRYLSALRRGSNNLGRGLKLLQLSSRARMMPMPCVYPSECRGNCRSTWNFCPLLPLSLTNFPPSRLSWRLHRVATWPHRDELFPPRRSCLQFSRKPFEFQAIRRRLRTTPVALPVPDK